MEASDLIIDLLDGKSLHETKAKVNKDKRYVPLLNFLDTDIYPILGDKIYD